MLRYSKLIDRQLSQHHDGINGIIRLQLNPWGFTEGVNPVSLGADDPLRTRNTWPAASNQLHLEFPDLPKTFTDTKTTWRRVLVLQSTSGGSVKHDHPLSASHILQARTSLDPDDLDDRPPPASVCFLSAQQTGRDRLRVMALEHRHVRGMSHATTLKRSIWHSNSWRTSDSLSSANAACQGYRVADGWQ